MAKLRLSCTKVPTPAKFSKVAKILNSSKSVKDGKDAANVIDYLHQHDSGLAVVS